MKPILIVLLLFLGADLAACKCAVRSISDKYAKSEFVARVKFLSFEENGTDKQSHTGQLEVLELFKGEALSSIKVMSRLNSSCAFLPKPGSEWLIFAQNETGVLSIGYCSGGEDMNPNKWSYYPKAQASNQRSLRRTLDFLRYVKANQLEISPFSDMGLGLGDDYQERLSGHGSNDDDFAVYTFEIRKKGKVKRLKLIKTFRNHELNLSLKKLLKSRLEDEKFLKLITAGTIVTGVLFSSASLQEEESYISPVIF